MSRKQTGVKGRPRAVLSRSPSPRNRPPIPPTKEKQRKPKKIKKSKVTGNHRSKDSTTKNNRLAKPNGRRSLQTLDFIEVGDIPDGFFADLDESDFLDDYEPVAGPSRPRNDLSSSPKCKGDSAQSNAESSTSAFRPMSRSILFGMARLSASPEPKSTSVHPQSRSRSPAFHTDILIDDTNVSKSSDRKGKKRDVGDHFDPPPLFGTAMIPEVVKLPNGKSAIEMRKAGESSTSNNTSDLEGRDKIKESLLLPSHIMVESELGEGLDDAQEKLSDEQTNIDMEGLHFLDDAMVKGVQRYFDPGNDTPQSAEATFLATADQSRLCQNCKRPGHYAKACPHTICTTCGAEDKHDRSECPFGLMCYNCGASGHRSSDCPEPHRGRNGCNRCGASDHMEISCHTVWRIYTYHTAYERKTAMEEKEELNGWAEQAIGGRPNDLWCYNCAREGHLGDDCKQRRGSLARFSYPSAFSHLVASRGPWSTASYQRSNLPMKPNFNFSSLPNSSRSSPSSTPKHHRFSDDETGASRLPHVTPGFEGSGAGRKTREKEKRKLRDLELSVENEDDEDDDEWFERRKKSSRGWDSERKPSPIVKNPGFNARGGRSGQSGNLPFSHTHLMSRESSGSGRDGIIETPTGSKGQNDKRRKIVDVDYLLNSAPAKIRAIKFGKISTPGYNGSENKDNHLNQTPVPVFKDTFNERNNGGRKVGDGSLALVNRALGGSTSSRGRNTTPSSSKNNTCSQNDQAISSPSSPLSMRINGIEYEIPNEPKRESRNARARRTRRERKALSSQFDEMEEIGDRDSERDRDNDRDWELEWRRNGNGGGSVIGWDEEMEEIEKKARRRIVNEFKNQKQLGMSIKGSSGKNSDSGGLNIKGRSGVNANAANGGSGQKYHGGY